MLIKTRRCVFGRKIHRNCIEKTKFFIRSSVWNIKELPEELNLEYFLHFLPIKSRLVEDLNFFQIFNKAH